MGFLWLLVGGFLVPTALWPSPEKKTTVAYEKKEERKMNNFKMYR